MDESISKNFLKNKHLLGIDYGRKITGLATYKYEVDPYPLTAGRLIYKDDKTLIKDINHFMREEFIDLIVVGVPFFTDGKESTMTKTIKYFVEKLKESTECDVFTIDETLTTFEAEERMKQDPRYNFKVDVKKVDELCAVIILEQFLKNSSD
jgi:putative holliday junction resolvase